MLYFANAVVMALACFVVTLNWLLANSATLFGVAGWVVATINALVIWAWQH